MKISEIIERRTPDWRELEADIAWISGNKRSKLDPGRVAAFARRYRAACSDLSQAISMRFPEGTTRYLHQLVAEAHTQLYRSESFRIRNWLSSLFVEVPARILADPCTWIAFFLFWSLFLGSLAAAALHPDFAVAVVGESALSNMDSMYAQPIGDKAQADSRAVMTGFYVFNNAGIGLQCFASGIFLGVGSLVTLAFNAIFLGAIFGHMLTSPASDNFRDFVTAHGPFELTAVVLAAAAGLRLGWAILDTKGWSRAESLRRTGPRALEMAGVATILFLLAAYIEGFFSPLSIAYGYKVVMAVATSLVLIFYIVILGLKNRGRRSNAA